MARRPFLPLAVEVLAVVGLLGCGAAPKPTIQSATPVAHPGATTPSSSAPTMATPSPGPTPSRSYVPAARPEVPPSCHLTKPTHPFVPPAGYPAPSRPPASSDGSWYGSAKLWTLLRNDGEVWYGLPHDPEGLGQKTVWWSDDFDVNREPQPAISVTGRRLDGPGRFVTPAPGTNASSDFGSAMLTGIEIPTPGCWEITASYRQASLSYVAWVVD